jgi:hypothetical protein
LQSPAKKPTHCQEFFRSNIYIYIYIIGETFIYHWRNLSIRYMGQGYPYHIFDHIQLSDQRPRRRRPMRPNGTTDLKIMASHGNLQSC